MLFEIAISALLLRGLPSSAHRRHFSVIREMDLPMENVPRFERTRCIVKAVGFGFYGRDRIC
jgi:hypothetical protein